MATVPVSVKGQVVLPAVVRRRLGITPGSRVEIDVAPDGCTATIRPAIRGKRSRVEDGVGMVPSTVGYIAAEELDSASILAKYGRRRSL